MNTAHRPGPLKAQPKAHKPGKHRTKGQVERDARGRTKLRGPSATRKAIRTLSKEARRQQTGLARAAKLREVVDARRAAVGGTLAPALVTVLVLGGEATSQGVLGNLAACDDSILVTQGHNVTYFGIPRFKSRLGFLSPDATELDDLLDCVKVSDVVCVVWPLDPEKLAGWAEYALSALLAHGMPSVVNILPGLASIQSGKQKEAARRAVEKLIHKWSLLEGRVLHADSVSDGLIVLRTLAEMKKKKMVLQRRRGHVLVEKLEANENTDGTCTLLASGYIRGPFLDVNRLVHIPGMGDFQLDKIETDDDPHPLRHKAAMSDGRALAATANPEKQQSLQSEVVPDPMDAEQTWPDQGELIDADKMFKKAETKKVPKGTSAYQAVWILDEDKEEKEGEEEEGNEDDMEDSEEEGSDEEDEQSEPAAGEEEGEEEEDTERDAEMDAQTEADEGEDGDEDDEDVDMDQVESYRRERENCKFPDEVDTPLDIPARVRFQKYRGLKSFRTSPWDPLENLPFDYARIFKFANFRRTRKLVMAAAEDSEAEGVVKSGAYATLYIRNVPSSFTKEIRSESPLVLYSLLPHEQKMSVTNLLLRKHPSCLVPIANKQKLIFQVGFRKFEAQPIFSQHGNADKFKMERYLRADGATVASIFAPITFPPASVLVFRVDSKGRQELVASGSVLDNNPDRVVLKRVVLSGHPLKINRHSVVARYMFFNREDIEWFKPVELYTPSGRRGHIKESLGTHGHMKCRFDEQLNAQDSVMMSLYKRAFPKWTYNPRVPQAEKSRLMTAS